MGKIDKLTRQSRSWNERALRISQQIQRAAALQAQARAVRSAEEEASRLNDYYGIWAKRRDWRQFEDVAFHIAASYRADLGYLLIYALRQYQTSLGYDPVQYVFFALQNLHLFRPYYVSRCVELIPEAEVFSRDSRTRGRAAAKLIVRELSTVPLRWASGIFAGLDATMRELVLEELQRFNPEGARILSRGSRGHLLSRVGFWQAVRCCVVGSLWRKGR